MGNAKFSKPRSFPEYEKVADRKERQATENVKREVAYRSWLKIFKARVIPLTEWHVSYFQMIVNACENNRVKEDIRCNAQGQLDAAKEALKWWNSASTEIWD